METYIIKLKKNKNQEVVEKVEMKDPETQNEKMGLPPRDRIPEFIRAYKTKNPLIDVDNLIKRPDFKIIYD